MSRVNVIILKCGSENPNRTQAIVGSLVRNEATSGKYREYAVK
jgi:hypothetical protein